MLRTTNVDDDVFAIAGGFGSGIGKKVGSGRVRVEIFYRVLSGTLFTLRYFGVLRVFRVDPKYGVLLDTTLYWVGYQKNV